MVLGSDVSRTVVYHSASNIIIVLSATQDTHIMNALVRLRNVYVRIVFVVNSPPLLIPR